MFATTETEDSYYDDYASSKEKSFIVRNDFATCIIEALNR